MKKTIALVTSGLNFNGNSLNYTAIGGSESALIYMAKELAILGNDVTVYCECDKPGIYDNVDYRHCHTFMQDEKSQFDVCIISRFTHFLAKPIDSKLIILWIHDISIQNPELSLSKVDSIFCLSNFQKFLFKKHFNIEDDIFWNTTNGFDETLIQPIIPFTDKKNNYIYSSRPERGLVKLLTDIWPKILETNPSAILHLCGYDNPLVKNESEYLTSYYEQSKKLISNSTNLIDHGSLTKNEYYKLLSQSAYMIYTCNFPEISCINAIEAQASGCLVVSSDGFALSETIKSDTKVSNRNFNNEWNEDLYYLVGDNEYDNEFLEILNKYTNETYDQEVLKAKELIQSYSWSNIAKSWDEKINSMFLERSNNNKQAILDQLIYMSDLVAVKELTGEQKYIELVEKSLKDNNIEDTYVERMQSSYNLTDRLTTVIEILKKNITDLNYNLKILDIGSHDGELAFYVLERFYFYIEKYYAYEKCSPALQVLEKNLKSKYDQIKLINDDILNLTNYNIDTNFVIIGEILEHIEDTVGFLNQLMLIVKQKTTFVFTTPAGPWDNIEKNKPKIEHMHHFELNDIREIFKETNLKIVNSNTNSIGRKGELLTHWVYYFSVEPDNIPSFYKPNYQDKFIKTRPYKKISASMIVKNEENNLDRCIKSFYDIVDEIVIVDTGSTDDTKRIAKKYTDKIYDYTWEEDDGLGNFSAARNYSLSKCSGDYILWMDADEELIHKTQLVQFIISDYYNSILVHQKHCIVYGDTNEYDSPYHDRLFKNNGIYFTGVVHEYPTKDEGWISKCLFQHISFIAHYGTINRPVRNEKIEDRYFDLIVKNYKQRPNFTMAQYYYMGLLCSICQNRGDLSKLEEIFDLWFNKIIPTEDSWLLKNSFNFIQSLYQTLYINEVINLPFGTLEKRQFENELGKTIELIASSDSEFQLFLDIISYKKITR